MHLLLLLMMMMMLMITGEWDAECRVELSRGEMYWDTDCQSMSMHCCSQRPRKERREGAEEKVEVGEKEQTETRRKQ